jgi:thymidylate synthase (FAD)
MILATGKFPEPGPTEVKVLDYGYVRLEDHMGNDASIVRSARVSYDLDDSEYTPERNEKLIHYLWKNQHSTPFESVTFTFEVKAPIFVFRQWHRHRTWAFNEISARYTELPEEFYIPEADVITTQSTKDKQQRTLEMHPLADQFREDMNSACESAFSTYRDMLIAGCPRELARSVLPVATYSRMYATVNLLNLFKFLKLRQSPHAQYEIRVYADAMLELIKSIVPVACEAFKAS